MVREPLSVFMEPNEFTKEIIRLEPGETVVVSPRIYDGFRKVLVNIRGRRRSGYIPTRKIRRSIIRERGAQAQSQWGEAYNDEIAVGVATVYSYLRQGESGFQESDGLTNWLFSELTSTTLFFSLFVDLPFDDTLGFRVYLAQRTTEFSGTARQESVSPTPTQGPIKREQTLLALGAVAKIYPQFASRWWWGGGMELAKGTSVNLSLNGIDIETTEQDLPFFLSFFGSVGGEFPVFKSVYLTPDIRVGSIATTKPFSVLAEGFMGVAYRF